MSERLSAMWLIQLFIGIFLLASGILYLTGSHEVTRGLAKAFGKNTTWPTVIAVVELISGIILLAGLFIGGQKWMFLACVVIFVIWSINILSGFVFNNFLKPNFFAWLKEISLYLVVLSGLWGVMMGSKE